MDSYIEQANRTMSSDVPAITSRFNTKRDVNLLHAAIGCVTESGEMLDALKKYLFYGKPVDVANMREEAGDLMWYLALLFHEMGWTFEGVGEINIQKLAARYPAKFSEYQALNRDLVAERAILESNDVLPAPEKIPSEIFEHRHGGPISKERNAVAELPGWYFWDETQADYHGPFGTLGECSEALKKYGEMLNAPKELEDLSDRVHWPNAQRR
jgi:NTP pyrophosphatase (non-canonical NTP hydrolase)